MVGVCVGTSMVKGVCMDKGHVCQRRRGVHGKGRHAWRKDVHGEACIDGGRIQGAVRILLECFLVGSFRFRVDSDCQISQMLNEH